MVAQSSDQHRQPQSIAARLVTVESQQETDLLTGERSERIFLKLYVEARTSGLLAAISDRDWKTLCTVATYMNQDGFCFPSQEELARALGCTRPTANERIQSLAAFRFQDNPVFCIIPSRRTKKGTWTRNGYRVLPIASLRIYDRPGEKRTMSANPDTVSLAPVSACTVSANPDTNKNQYKPEEENSNFERSPNEHFSDARASRQQANSAPDARQTAADVVESAQQSNMPASPVSGLTGPQNGEDTPSHNADLTAAVSPGFAQFRRDMDQFRANLAEQKRKDHQRPARRRSTDVPDAPAPSPQPTVPTTAAAPPPPVSPASIRSRGRSPGSREHREHIGAYLTDIMRELHDQANLPSSITRAHNLFLQANVPPERWGSVLYEARAITQERSGSIDKQITLPSGWDVKNKVPYFFGVLEDLIGLKPQSG